MQSSSRPALIWRDWHEEEVIVFNRATGDTHLVSPLAFLALEKLESLAQATSSFDLAVSLQDAFETATPVSEIHKMLNDIQPKLQNIGLLARHQQP